MSFLRDPGGLCAPFYAVETPPDPTVFAVTPDTLRDVLRLDCEDMGDDVALGHIASAQLIAERYSGIVLFKTTFKLSLPLFPLRIELRKRPVIAVTVIDRRIDGVETVVPAEDYRLIQRNCYPYISLSDGACWPTDADLEDDAVSVTFDAGISAIEEDIPADIKSAITSIAVDEFENPGDCSTDDGLPGAAKKILNLHRCRLV